MIDRWQNMVQRLETRPLSGIACRDIAGEIEMMMIHLPVDPGAAMLDIARQCLRLMTPLPGASEIRDILSRCLIRLGRVNHRLGNPELATDLFTQAADCARIAECPHLEAIAYMEIGELARRRGDLNTAHTYQSGALTISEATGLDREQADALNNMANIAIESGDLDTAECLLTRSLAIAEDIGETRLEGHIYNNLGVINSLRGCFDEAIADFTRALPRREQAGDEKGVSETYHNLGLAYLDSGNPALSDTYIKKALEKARDIRDAGQETHILLTVTELLYHTMDYAYALTMAEQLTHRQVEIDDQPGLAETKKLMGRIFLDQGAIEQAEHALSNAANMFRELGMLPGEAETLKELGICCRRQGRITESNSYLHQARTLFEYLGNRREIDSIDTIDPLSPA
ncbi:tetratricopeptide repeat protein [bacterium]|nr:tetratricopeptide repeat protein [candidate division CSSED10-310 bacterium]